MSNIMVTGARGFVGRALVKKLKEMNHEVIEIRSDECDLTDSNSISFLSHFDADYVFHVAGKVGIPASVESPLAFYKGNVDTTRHVLEYCRLHGKSMHYVSAYVYGVPPHLPIDEQLAPNPNNPYAHSKWMAESLCQFYQKNFKVPVTISRPFNIYGLDKSSSLFIASIYHQLQTKDSVTVGDLTPMRDYVYIDDVIDALIAIMQKGESGEIYNIGTGVSHSCEFVINMLQSLMNTKKPIVETKAFRASELMDVRADIGKISAHTGWKPKYSLSQGLANMLGESYV